MDNDIETSMALQDLGKDGCSRVLGLRIQFDGAPIDVVLAHARSADATCGALRLAASRTSA